MEHLCSAEIECLVIPPKGGKDSFEVKKKIRFRYEEPLSESWYYDLCDKIKSYYGEEYSLGWDKAVVKNIAVRDVMEINPIYITCDDTDLEYTL